MLEAVHRKIPEIYRYIQLSYGSPYFLLFFDNHFTLFQEGTQQGDPPGPLFFCLTVHPILTVTQSHLSIGYIDEFTVGGPEDVVCRDNETIMDVGDTSQRE